MQKLTHVQFIGLCQSKGINVTKITRTHAHFGDGKLTKLPSLNGVEIMIDAPTPAIQRPYTTCATLGDAIRRDSRIDAIKIVRSLTGAGLFESKKYVCDDNWELLRQAAGIA